MHDHAQPQGKHRLDSQRFLTLVVGLTLGYAILVSSLRLFREVLHTLLEGVPTHLNLEEVGRAMAGVEGVLSVHDLHIWSLSGRDHRALGPCGLAAQRGYAYLAITDHSRNVRVANGLGKKRLSAQIDEIDRLNEKLNERMLLLKSIELDILKDGSLDLERVVQGAAERGCFLEVNAQPRRLDLNDTGCRLVKEVGAKVAISTDAHAASNLAYMRFGVDQARRGWLEADDVINTRPLSVLRKLLER